jgi:hypothetical protein
MQPKFLDCLEAKRGQRNLEFEDIGNLIFL